MVRHVNRKIIYVLVSLGSHWSPLINQSSWRTLANPSGAVLHKNCQHYSLSGVACKEKLSTSRLSSGFARSCVWPLRTLKCDSFCVLECPFLWAVIKMPLMWVTVWGWGLSDVIGFPLSLGRTHSVLPMSIQSYDVQCLWVVCCFICRNFIGRIGIMKCWTLERRCTGWL